MAWKHDDRAGRGRAGKTFGSDAAQSVRVILTAEAWTEADNDVLCSAR
jgi:hypothetical protein